MGWQDYTVNVLLSAAVSFIVGTFMPDSKTEEKQVGVESVDLNHPVYQVINSTNVRLDALADQHSDHQEQVKQIMMVGWVSIGLLGLSVLMACCALCYVFRRKRPIAQRAELQEIELKRVVADK